MVSDTSVLGSAFEKVRNLNQDRVIMLMVSANLNVFPNGTGTKKAFNVHIQSKLL